VTDENWRPRQERTGFQMLGGYPRRRSQMRDQNQRRGTPQDTLQALAEVLRIQGGEAFIQNHQFGLLQQSARQEDSRALALDSRQRYRRRTG